MENLLRHIQEQEIVDLACDLVNVPSPTGHERAVGEFVFEWLTRHGIDAVLQELGGDRVNVVGTLPGSGLGTSLQLNGHLDTNYSGTEDDLIYMSPALFGLKEHSRRAYVEGGQIFGVGIGNMKAGLTAMLTTIKALKQCELPMLGDFVIAGVSGENGGAPVDRYQGVEFEGAGFGTAHLLSHGIQTDYAICADNSNFKMTWVSPGMVLLRITVYGLPGGAWATPTSGRPEDNQNAIIRMVPVIQRLEAWAEDYSDRYRYHCAGGELTPTAHIGHIEGGRPYNMAVRPGVCAISMLVMTPPGLTPTSVKKEIETVLRDTNVDFSVAMYKSSMGYEAQGISPLVNVLREHHRQLFGTELELCDPPYCGPWTDTALYNERGIPCLKLGLGLSAADRLRVGISAYDQHPIEDIVRAAKLYAATAMDFCNRQKPPSI